MAGMEGLGRLFNIIPTADGVFVNLTEATGVTFFGVGADTYTIQSSATASGGTDLAVISHYYSLAAADGSVAWVRQPSTAASDVSPTASRVVAANGALFVSASSLPAGHKYVKCTSTSTGLVYALVHDLASQRAPYNLAALGV